MRAGPISAVHDGVELRWICYEDREILRGIYGAVRDSAWRTIEPTVRSVQVRSSDDRVDLRLRVRHRSNGVDFSWRGHLILTASGVVEYRFRGLARTTFARNRIGLCVLHPISLAGTPVTITSVSGESRPAQFPDDIDPASPFRDIASMHWDDGRTTSTLEFAGEVFETEDQRNWADASYKTFGTPLDLPYPVTVAAGTRVDQRVALRVEPSRAVPPARSSGTPAGPPSAEVITLDPATARPLPLLGTSLAPGREQLPEAQTGALAELGLSLLRVVVDLAWPGWQERLLAAAAVAARVASRLTVELVLDPGEDQLAEFGALIAGLDTPPHHCLVFSCDGYATSAHDLDRVREVLRASGASFPVGGGSRASFAELNRAVLPLADLDLIGCPVATLVHAVDDATAMENIEAVAHVVRGCLRVAKGRPVVVGPVTLRPRYNAYGQHRAVLGPQADGERLDERQRGAFAAAWTLAALAELPDASAVILHEASGPAGLLPEDGDADADPLYGVVRLIGSARPGDFVAATVPAGLSAFGLTVGADLRVFVANRTDRSREVILRLAGAGRRPVSVSVRAHDWTNVLLDGG